MKDDVNVVDDERSDRPTLRFSCSFAQSAQGGVLKRQEGEAPLFALLEQLNEDNSVGSLSISQYSQGDDQAPATTISTVMSKIQEMLHFTFFG